MAYFWRCTLIIKKVTIKHLAFPMLKITTILISMGGKNI